MNILDIFNKLSKNNNYTVGIYLSQSSVLEVILYDNSSKTIIKSARSAEVIFDLTTRQIDRIDIFNLTIIKLLEKLKVPSNTPIVISIPTVLTHKQILPLNLSDDEVRTVLVSDAERNYIFKKQEPYVSWQQLKTNVQDNTQEVLFSAIQATQIDLIKEGLKDYKIIAIDSSYTSLLAGLANLGIIDKEIESSANWQLVLTTPLNFLSLEFKGNTIVNISDSPVAVRSLNSNEIYSTVISHCDENVNYYNIEHLIIISEQNEVEAKVLAEMLNKKCKISTFEQNKFANKIAAINEECSEEFTFLQTIGAASWGRSNIKVGLNFLAKSESVQGGAGVLLTILGKTFSLTSPLIEKILLILIIITFLSASLMYLFLSTMIGASEKSLQDINAKKYKYQQIIELNKNKEGVQAKAQVSSATDIASVYDKNSKLVQSFVALGQVIPEKLWVEKFELSCDGATAITGQAYSIDDITNYYQNLVVVGGLSNLKMTSIKVSGSDGPSKTAVTIVSSSNKKVAELTPKKMTKIGDLPNLPNLPSIAPVQGGISEFTSTKYYEFTFGSDIASVTAKAAPLSTTPPAATPATPSPAAAPPPASPIPSKT